MIRMPLPVATRSAMQLLTCLICFQVAVAQVDRLPGFTSRLLSAEQRLGIRKPARKAGEVGGDLVYGIRAEARLQNAVRRYEAIVKDGGWPIIPNTKSVRRGDRDPRVPQIRQRLVWTGDLDSASVSKTDVFDDALHDAVVRFQVRHGLPNEGNVGRLTIAAMNVQASVRLAQLKRNLARIEGMRQFAGTKRAVVVNIPAFELQAIVNDDVVFSSRVIVGRIDRKTPELSTRIVSVDLLPTWRVPPGITARDMLPRLRSEPGYFVRENFRVIRAADNQVIDPLAVDWTLPSVPKVRFEQAPGANNALGLVRIDMPNKHVVYLHDTPLRKLFDKPARPFSSGCVRVDKIAELAVWLLRDQPKWSANSISDAIKSGRPVSIKLTSPIPVHFVYLTSWVEPDGDVNFREDIYRLDGASPLAAKYIDRILPTQPLSP
jgi:L,D-transpeptidase YcbB